MPDLGILEILIAFFLFIPFAAPHIKALSAVDGFLWFGPIALFCVILIFPAYGFRPECIPLLIFTVIYNFFNTKRFFFTAAQRYADGLEQGVFHFVIPIIFLTAAVYVALRYLPMTETGTLDSVRVIRENDSHSGTQYYIRVYETAAAQETVKTSRLAKTLVIAAPPVLGSVSVIDKICGGLSARGVPVISFSRKDLDFPACGIDGRPMAASFITKPVTIKKALSSLITGWKDEKSNTDGRYFEYERFKDLNYMLSFAQKTFQPETIFIVGYGAAGSALVTLSSSPDIKKNMPQLKGGIVIEGRLFSFFDTFPPAPADTEKHGTGAILAQKWKSITGWERGRVTAAVNTMPKTYIPLLFVLPDEGAWENPEDSPYQAARAFVKKNEPLVKLISPEGSGPADFSDIPEKYPLLPAFFDRPPKSAWDNTDSVRLTTKFIMDFIAER